jgi:hypothetical protein
MEMETKYKFLSKTIFFPKQGILAVGDLHLGYENMLRNQGIMINFNQLEDTKKELELIIKKIKAVSTLKKIILLGDIKHHFSFDKSEIFDLGSFLKFISKFVGKENVILIKGNHDTFTIKEYTLRDFYTEDDLAFFHGDKWFKELENKDIKFLISAHIHPAVWLKDKSGIKREKYKAFLVGNFKRKKLIVVPSFFPLVDGSEINELYSHSGKHFSILSKISLKNFDVYIVGKNRIYFFGKYEKII